MCTVSGEVRARFQYIVQRNSRPARHGGAVRQKGQECDPLDAPVMPVNGGQRGAPSASCSGLQSRELLPHTRAADEVERWSLTTLREKVVKVGAKIITH